MAGGPIRTKEEKARIVMEALTGQHTDSGDMQEIQRSLIRLL